MGLVMQCWKMNLGKSSTNELYSQTCCFCFCFVFFSDPG